MNSPTFVLTLSHWTFRTSCTPRLFRKSLVGGVTHNNIDELLHYTFRDTREETSRVRQCLNEDAKRFFRLLEDGKQELFPRCKKISKLSFIIRLFLYKTLHGLSNVAFDDLLQLLKEVIPDIKLPTNFFQAKKTVSGLGLDYKKILACLNDCMLYWKEYEHADVCHICHTSKWKQTEEKQGSKRTNNHPEKTSKVPAKVVWHFPLKPRLQRLFMCLDTAKHMTRHDQERPKDGNLRHPADGQSWKEFDSLYPIFAKEPRNVRLGLSSDGFNPFRTKSIAHSTWLVVLDHNHQELKDLWVDGLETYDKYKDETFKMHAALMWTISDFPGYSMLSRWKTKGKFACPLCP
ncbi:hypothetical protein LXL04_028041 [Taraxacum kok-saghyz]